MDIEYTGKNGKSLGIRFGGKESGVSFRVPAANGQAPRVVTFDTEAAPDAVAGAKAALLATGLYREIKPKPAPKAKED